MVRREEYRHLGNLLGLAESVQGKGTLDALNPRFVKDALILEAQEDSCLDDTDGDAVSTDIVDTFLLRDAFNQFLDRRLWGDTQDIQWRIF